MAGPSFCYNPFVAPPDGRNAAASGLRMAMPGGICTATPRRRLNPACGGRHSSHARPTLDIEEAVLQTVLYADIFDYPLTPAEIHYYLISTSASAAQVSAVIEDSAWLRARLSLTHGVVTVNGREAIAAVREARGHSSAQLWPLARRWAAVIDSLPFVRMVAVTGALAVDNAPAGDDIDFLIVTAPGRVWLARALAVGVVRGARLFGVGLCPNYVLAHSALSQQKRNLFIAHDLAQMVPLSGPAVYAEMRAANAWAQGYLPQGYLPQASGPLRAEPELRSARWRTAFKRAGEWLLGGRLGEALERWERDRKLRKFAPVAGQASSAAELDADRVKGHFDDHGHPILQKFNAPERRGASDITQNRNGLID